MIAGYVVLFVSVLAIASIVAAWWRTRVLTKALTAREPTGIERLYREKTVVTLKTGEAFSGVLYEHNEREIVLRGAYGLAMKDGRDDVQIDGEVLIFTRDIAYMQKP